MDNPDLLARIAAALPSVELLGSPSSDPRLVLGGRMQLPEALHVAAQARRAELRAAGRRVDVMAVLRDDATLREDPPTLLLETIDFADLRVLRDLGPVPVVNAMAVLVAPERRLVVVHRRAADAHPYPGALHAVGGSYAPPGPRAENDKSHLRWTAAREVFEELGLLVSLAEQGSDRPGLLLLRERDTGAVLMAYLGARIVAGLDAPDVDHDEGHLCAIGFDDLEETLAAAERWAPSGRAAVLTWLALGAPGAPPDARFGDVEAATLCARLLPSR